MKNIIAILFVLLSATTTNAQYFPDTAWTRCYGGSGEDFGIDIHQTFEGGYIVLGKSRSTDGNLLNTPAGWKKWILKLDSTGNIEWQAVMTDSFMNFSNIQQTSDSGYIVGGDVFTKLKADGSIDWQQNIPTEFVLQTYDGGYALLKSPSLVYIRKLDASGNPVWSTICESNLGMGGDYVSDFLEAHDSSLVLSGRGAEEFVGPGPWFNKTNFSGTEERNIAYSAGSFGNMVQTLDYNFAILYQAGFGGPSLKKINDSVQTIWQQSIPYEGPNDIMENIDTTYVVCGYLDSNSQVDAYLSKHNSSGVETTVKMFGGSETDQFRTVITTNDTGYIAIGLTRSNDGYIWGHHDSSDIWIVKFKQDTSVHVPPPVLSVNHISWIDDVRVYPTLSNGIANVSLPKGCEEVGFELFNMMGQAIEVYSTGSGMKRSIDMSGQAAGQYILQVKAGQERKSFRITYMP